MNATNLINTIKRMLTDKLTASEREQLLNEKPMIRFQARQWEKAPKKHLEENVSSQTILHKVMARCHSAKQPVSYNKKYFRMGYSIAATIVLFIVSCWLVNNLSSSYIKIITYTQEKRVFMLPDSSEVWLNEASEICYHKSFSDNRKVFLKKGEAFFKVKKKQGAPFSVFFHQSHVEVTGTEFNIKSGDSESEITLFTGSIKFQAEKGQEEIPMSTNERIIYNMHTKSVVCTNIDANEYDWRSDKYHFTNKPLQEFVEFINRSHDTQVIIKGKGLKELRFNGTIHKNEPLKDIIEKICISLDLQMKTEKDSIILF